MTHPHSNWDRAALERYVGTTEALKLEFKSHRGLLPDAKKTRSDRILEASRDVAGMANEQGGTIIYGIEESGESGFRTAKAVGEGFSGTDKVDREWFIQIMRDHINPPLTELDVAQIKLDDSHVALVVDVPQARGVARQTDDLFFPRRDAQGLHNMTVQEIEDVRARAERAKLDLRIITQGGTLKDDRSGYLVDADFEVANVSVATATFTVITLAFMPPAGAIWRVENAWRLIPTGTRWQVIRAVIASGSSPHWSPITPGFTVSPEHLLVDVPRAEIEGSWRTIGFARIDHDGGRQLSRIDFGPHAGLNLRLEPFPGETDPSPFKAAGLPELFSLNA